jgi:hypothetical protein
VRRADLRALVECVHIIENAYRLGRTECGAHGNFSGARVILREDKRYHEVYEGESGEGRDSEADGLRGDVSPGFEEVVRNAECDDNICRWKW